MAHLMRTSILREIITNDLLVMQTKLKRTLLASNNMQVISDVEAFNTMIWRV